MGFGGASAPTPPTPQPVTPVPQEDDPKGLEEQRKVAAAAKTREGYGAHLLTGKGSGDPISGSSASGRSSKLME